MQYLLRRIGFYLIPFWCSLTLNFLIRRLMPVAPVLLLMAKLQGRVDPQSIQALRIAFGVNTHQSIWQQYAQYLANLAHGNLGVSITYFPMPVTDVIAQSLPWTLVLVGTAAVISFLLGTLLGTLAAWRRGSWLGTKLALT